MEFPIKVALAQAILVLPEGPGWWYKPKLWTGFPAVRCPRSSGPGVAPEGRCAGLVRVATRRAGAAWRGTRSSGCRDSFSEGVALLRVVARHDGGVAAASVSCSDAVRASRMRLLPCLFAPRTRRD